ncbi:carbohydrate ABC transporter permease [Pseudooctadecabacter jejudonensis]|uniref:Trehalose transport system permease protein SugA n=1 Tax=Pseudooctadecabacter jejudonensis TaxID=1391910 RepID=A0A1Y5T0L9_9RHOB|nr:sugar ABC transporter permease [Pseudooctadecabacter jejudonensis]SLN51359.1 Trehalose transport system permease protein SugA [Pseudooctadecabacter jejudonensis]
MQDRLLPYWLLIPAFVIVLATTIYPLAYSFFTSFRAWDLTQSRRPEGFVGLENYVYAASEEQFLNSLWVTFIFVITSVFLTVVLAMALALLLRRKGPMHTFTRIVLILPFAMSPALIGVSYRFMFNPEFGVLAKGLGAVFPALEGVPWLADPQLAMGILVLTDVWHWTPYMTFMCLGGLASIPRETEEAARIDGASNLRIVFGIILPQMKGVIAVMAVLKTIFALKMFDQVVTLTGGGPGTSTETLAYFIFNVGFRWFDMGYASALAWILTAIMMVISIWYVRMLLSEKKMATA